MSLPFAHRVTRVTIIGDCFGGAEEWSTGFFMGNESADADLPTQQLADDIKAAWQTFFSNGQSYISTSWRTTEIKVSSFGTDGKSDANDTVYSTYTTPPTGVASNLFPPQITLAATMTGAKARGIASKGRMYLPGVNISVGGNGKISGANVQYLANQFGTFIKNVNASTATPNVVVLASHGQLTKGLDGKLIPKVDGIGPDIKAVTSVKIGDVLDTQRRRRNGLTEVYATGSIL